MEYHKIGNTRVAIRVEGPVYALARPLPPRSRDKADARVQREVMPVRRERLKKDRRHGAEESWLDLR